MKEYLPPSIREYLSGIKSSLIGRQVFYYDHKRFLKSYANRKLRSHSQEQLEGRLIFHAHSLEKGMSHDVIRYGFGKRTLLKLSKAMSVYHSKGFNISSLAYINALSVLKKYMELHANAKQNTSFVEEIFEPKIMRAIQKNNADVGGVFYFDKSSKKHNRIKNFKDLFLNRWSTREYEDTPVDLNLIREAIEIATKSPSICNRQSGRVRIMTDTKKIKAALSIQRGMTGYKLPPVLLTVTTDSSSFIDLTERNQIYIDGGLFAMALLMGLEYVSLAACPLNAMFSVRQDKDMRKLMSIPDNENFIMFIAVGNFKTNNKVPKSFRYAARDITNT